MVVDLPELLGALPGDEDFDVAVVGVDRLLKPGLLALGEPLLGASE